MAGAWTIANASEADVRRFAEVLALKLRPGDVVALRGDLGAGKTTLARALIRGVLGEPEAEVPSPTFAIQQPYDADRMRIAHFDFYRLSGGDELGEIGVEDALADGAVLIEWPERAEEALPAERLEISLTPGDGDDRRQLVVDGSEAWLGRLQRLRILYDFLGDWVASTTPAGAGAPGLRVGYLQGDASSRAYARVWFGETSFVLMDSPRMPDGPAIFEGRPYSRIAHLAEDVRPFVAIGSALRELGLSAPRIHAADLDAGVLLLEDLGDMTLARAIAAGVPQDKLWSGAVDVLVALRRAWPTTKLPAVLPDGTHYALPRFDRAALEIELRLILEWYWPEVKGGPVPSAVRAEFLALWAPLLERLLGQPPGLFLRDYHSPNLFWLPERAGVRRIGVIDFQDALAESWANDLVSLLQDARLDVSSELEAAARARYLTEIASIEPGFDEAAFLAAYATFGAQRNTRLIGLWVRLLRRDGKPGYLQHMARTWDYLERNLRHPDLESLREWYDHHFPASMRGQSIRP